MRLRDRLFALTSACSAALFAATLTLWVRSYRVSDEWRPGTGRPPDRVFHLLVGAERGRIGVGTIDETLLPWQADDPPMQGEDPRPRQWVTWQHLRFVPSETAPRGRWPDWAARLGFRRYGFSGICGGPHGGRVRLTFETLFVPLWLPALVTAAWPCLYIRRRIRARRNVEAGLCSSCGYDLRATPDRCPECGTVITQVGR